jgi:hypothetical protein
MEKYQHIWATNSMSRTVSIFKIVLLTSFLMSCTAASNYYENLKHTSSLRYFVSEEEKLARYQDTCRSIGITEESEQWEGCLIQAKTIDDNAAAQRGAVNRASAQQRHQANTARAMACGASPANC